MKLAEVAIVVTFLFLDTTFATGVSVDWASKLGRNMAKTFTKTPSYEFEAAKIAFQIENSDPLAIPDTVFAKYNGIEKIKVGEYSSSLVAKLKHLYFCVTEVKRNNDPFCYAMNNDYVEKTDVFVFSVNQIGNTFIFEEKLLKNKLNMKVAEYLSMKNFNRQPNNLFWAIAMLKRDSRIGLLELLDADLTFAMNGVTKECKVIVLCSWWLTQEELIDYISD